MRRQTSLHHQPPTKSIFALLISFVVSVLCLVWIFSGRPHNFGGFLQSFTVLSRHAVINWGECHWLDRNTFTTHANKFLLFCGKKIQEAETKPFVFFAPFHSLHLFLSLLHSVSFSLLLFAHLSKLITFDHLTSGIMPRPSDANLGTVMDHWSGQSSTLIERDFERPVLKANTPPPTVLRLAISLGSSD